MLLSITTEKQSNENKTVIMRTKKDIKNNVSLRKTGTKNKELTNKKSVSVCFTEITTEERNRLRLDAYDYIL